LRNRRGKEGIKSTCLNLLEKKEGGKKNTCGRAAYHAGVRKEEKRGGKGGALCSRGSIVMPGKGKKKKSLSALAWGKKGSVDFSCSRKGGREREEVIFQATCILF